MKLSSKELNQTSFHHIHPHMVLLALGLATAILYFVYSHIHRQYLIPTDTYYYIALADSLLETGSLLDITSIPPQPLRTYQNGIVFLYVLLKTIGLNDLSAINAVSLINFLVWISALYPFYRLITYGGITSKWVQGFLLFGFLGSGVLLNYQTTPGTDGLFNGGILWIVFFFVSIYRTYQSNCNPKPSEIFLNMLLTVLLSTVLVHFSIRLFIYQAALLFAIVLVKGDGKIRLTIFSIILVAVTLSSLTIPYAVFEPQMVVDKTGIYDFSFFNRSVPVQKMLSIYLGLGSLLNNINGYIVLAFLGSIIISILVVSLTTNNFINVFISTCLTLFLLTTFMLPNAVMVQAGARYIISTLPLLCLAMMCFKYSRPPAFLLIASYGLLTIFSLFAPVPRYCISSFWTEFAEQPLDLPDNAILLSERSRYSYTFLNKRNYALPLATIDASVEYIFLAGSIDFINQKMKLIQDAQNLSVNQSIVIKSDNLKHCLSALIQCDITVLNKTELQESQPTLLDGG